MTDWCVNIPSNSKSRRRLESIRKTRNYKTSTKCPDTPARKITIGPNRRRCRKANSTSSRPVSVNLTSNSNSRRTASKRLAIIHMDAKASSTLHKAPIAAIYTRRTIMREVEKYDGFILWSFDPRANVNTVKLMTKTQALKIFRTRNEGCISLEYYSKEIVENVLDTSARESLIIA